MYDEIEKTNLEAHVAICAIRYQNLNDQLESLDQVISNLDSRIDHIETGLNEIKEMVSSMATERHNQLINWGVGIIATLAGAVAFLAYQLFTKGTPLG